MSETKERAHREPHVNSSPAGMSRSAKMPTRVSAVAPSTHRWVSQLGSHALLISRLVLPFTRASITWLRATSIM